MCINMKTKIWSVILKAPLIILILIGWIVSIFDDSTFFTKIIYTIILVLYFIGVFLGRIEYESDKDA